MSTQIPQTPQTPGWGPSVQQEQQEQPHRKPRIFMWVILAINALFLVWIIMGTQGAASSVQDCSTLTGDALDMCNAGNTGTAIGASIGVFLIVAFWAFVDVILGVIYLVTRKR